MRPDSSLRRAAWVLAACLLGTGATLAAPAWTQLTERQQALIEPALRTQGGNFDALPEARREALVRGADRWLAMSPEQRNVASQQFQRWQQLSTAERVQVLERRERFRKLPADQRKALLEAQKQFLEMPLQQQAELRNQFFKDLQNAAERIPSELDGSGGTPIAPSSNNPLGLPVNPASPLGLPVNLAPVTNGVIAPLIGAR